MNYAREQAYCTETGLPLGTPGYYSMVFKNLTRVWRYDPTGDPAESWSPRSDQRRRRGLQWEDAVELGPMSILW